MTSPLFRDKQGIYRLTYPTVPRDVDAISVTTANSKGIPQPVPLKKWSENQLVDRAYKLGTEQPDLDVQVVRKQVRDDSWESTKQIFAKGDAIHAAAERLLRGEELHEWDLTYEAQVNGARSFIEDSKFVATYIERTVVKYEPPFAGTSDAIGHMPMLDGPGIIDWKSGSAASAFSEKSAMQMAAYAHADYIVGEDGKSYAPFDLEIEWVGVVHLPDTGGYVFRAYEGAELEELYEKWLHVHAVAALAMDGLPGGWSAPFDFDALPKYRAELRERVQQILDWGGGAELAEKWPQDIPTLKHDGHTTHQLDAIEYLLRRIEPSWRPKPPVASRGAHDAAIATLEGLTPEALETISKYAAAAGIPKLKGYQATDEQLAQLDRIIVAVCRAPDPEDRAARIGRATKGRTTSPAGLTADDMPAFSRTRKSKANSQNQLEGANT